jgi:hypothetical protein
MFQLGVTRMASTLSYTVIAAGLTVPATTSVRGPTAAVCATSMVAVITSPATVAAVAVMPAPRSRSRGVSDAGGLAT